MVTWGIGLARGAASLAIAVSAAGALGGCGSETSGGSAQSNRHAHDASSDVTCGEEVRLDVVDNGASPRYPMILDLAAGQQDLSHADIDVTTSTGMSEYGAPVEKSPKVSVDMTADIVSIVDNADSDAIQVTSRYENVATNGPVGQTIVDALQGKVTKLHFTPRGRMIEGEAESDPTAQQLSSFMTPFPDENMGAGAKWQAWRPVDTGGVQMCFLTTYSLDEFDGHAYELSGDVKIVVIPGTSEQENQGVTITIDSRGGEGRGTMRNQGSLSEFSPQSGEATSSMNFTIATSAPDVGEIVMTTDQKMNATFTRGAA